MFTIMNLTFNLVQYNRYNEIKLKQIKEIARGFLEPISKMRKLFRSKHKFLDIPKWFR